MQGTTHRLVEGCSEGSIQVSLELWGDTRLTTKNMEGDPLLQKDHNRMQKGETCPQLHRDRSREQVLFMR